MKYLLILGLLVGCATQKGKRKYSINDCHWHVNVNNYKELGIYYRTTQYVNVKGEPYYIDEILNYTYDYDVTLYKLTSASYIDDYHESYTYEQKCRKGIRKDLIEKCIKEGNWKFTSASVKCPTKEEYKKLKVKYD